MTVIARPTARALPMRTEPTRAVILHTTGATQLDEILRWYTSPAGLQPHYVIACDGEVYGLVDEGKVAYHAKIDPAEARLYQQGYGTWSEWVWCDGRPVHAGHEASNYRTWRDTWRSKGIQSPLELVTGAHPNGRSIGIELQQPAHPGPHIFTDAQYESLATLVADIGQRQHIAVDRAHVFSHYDVSPMRRSTVHGSWDPGEAFSWLHLWDLLGKGGVHERSAG